MIDLEYKARILVKLLIYKLFSKRTKLMNDETYNKLIFWVTFSRIPNFDNPQTFNEYICARKVRRDEYDLWRYTDKYEVRKYVEETVGSKYLNENYAIYDNFDQIEFDKLPNRFALRCTHGSGYNLIVTDKSKLIHKTARKRINKWLGENFYYLGREKNYYRIKPRIMCDKFLECKNSEGLPEIKVFCFNGKTKFISYNLVLEGKTYSNIYDENWQLLQMRRGYSHFKTNGIPDNHNEIIQVAEKLAKAFDFVRVDLYNVDNCIVFSELTFHSGGGFVPFSPSVYDREFAKFFKELDNPL